MNVYMNSLNSSIYEIPAAGLGAEAGIYINVGSGTGIYGAGISRPGGKKS